MGYYINYEEIYVSKIHKRNIVVQLLYILCSLRNIECVLITCNTFTKLKTFSIPFDGQGELGGSWLKFGQKNFSFFNCNKTTFDNCCFCLYEVTFIQCIRLGQS